MKRPVTICGSCGQIIDHDINADRILRNQRRIRVMILAVGVVVFLDLVFR